MKANPDKCHFLLNSDIEHEILVGNKRIKSSKHEKLLGIKFDNKLNFNLHMKAICKIASKKIHALARVTAYMDLPKDVYSLTRFLNPSLITAH